MAGMTLRPETSDQRGVALITILLIVSVLTAIVARLSLSSEVWVRQVESGAALAQARQVSRAAQHWVGLILERDDNDYDAPTDPWGRPLPPLPVGWGELSGDIEDRQGRFNLNNLVTAEGEVDQAALGRFQRLLRLLELGPGIAAAAADWIDSDTRPQGAGGAEDSLYLGRRPPYLTANRLFGEPAELRLVRGVGRKAWRKLRPHVSALPEATGVNVNTATPEVLAAVVLDWGAPRLALARAQRLAESRGGQPFATLEGFANAAGVGSSGDSGRLTVSSKFFMAHTVSRFGRAEHRLATLYRRQGGKAEVVRHRAEIR